MAAVINIQYEADLDRWLADFNDRIGEIWRHAVVRVGEEVIKGSPVDTGFFRGQWTPSLGAEPPYPADQNQGSTDPHGQRALAALTLMATQMTFGETLFFVNNAIYGMRLNYGFVGADSLGREYNQPGRYFVEDAIAKWYTIFDDVAGELRR